MWQQEAKKPAADDRYGMNDTAMDAIPADNSQRTGCERK
jgi:hypothetical protein